jgi:hypothetical protein
MRARRFIFRYPQKTGANMDKTGYIQQFIRTIQAIGLFWTATNEPPPESILERAPQPAALAS